MIIQCRRCETRFRFDDALVDGDGVWVRCSRCQNVFFEPKPAAEAAAGGPDIPSVTIRDARRGQEEPLSALGDPPRRSDGPSESLPPASARPESETDRVWASPLRAETAGEPDFDREPELGGPGGGFERGAAAATEEAQSAAEGFGPLVDADQRPAVEELSDDEEAADDAPRGGGWGWLLLKAIIVLLFAGLVAGSVYLYLYPELRRELMEWAGPRLQGVPVLEKLVPAVTGSEPAPPVPVLIRDVRDRSVVNLLVGNLRVVEGVAVNQAPYPLARISVRMVIADAYDVVLGERVVYCGNLLTDAELGALAEAEIQRELSIPQGSDVSNERVPPNGAIPFMVVFSQDSGAVKTTLMPAGADRLP